MLIETFIRKQLGLKAHKVTGVAGLAPGDYRILEVSSDAKGKLERPNVLASLPGAAEELSVSERRIQNQFGVIVEGPLLAIFQSKFMIAAERRPEGRRQPRMAAPRRHLTH